MEVTGYAHSSTDSGLSKRAPLSHMAEVKKWSLPETRDVPSDRQKFPTCVRLTFRSRVCDTRIFPPPSKTFKVTLLHKIPSRSINEIS
jgi:hypothetical protein